MTIDFAEKASLIKQGLVTSVSTLLLTGCSISVPQAESSYRFVKELISSDEGSSQDQQAIWLASVGDRGAVLRPYLSGGLTVFANTDGDAIAFDGWTIRSVTGFGLGSSVSIAGKEGRRIFVQDGIKVSVVCGDWKFKDSTWKQSCTNGTGKIEIDEIGNIIEIIFSLGDEFGGVTSQVVHLRELRGLNQ